MSDLVERLRHYIGWRTDAHRSECHDLTWQKPADIQIAEEAASRISQQDAELERLRGELAEAKEFRAILEGHLSAAIDDYNDARREQFDAMVDARMEAFFVGWEMSHAASVEDTCAEAWEFWRLMEDGRDEVEARAPGDLQAQGGEQ